MKAIGSHETIIKTLKNYLYDGKVKNPYYSGWNDAIRKILNEIETQHNRPITMLKMRIMSNKQYIKHHANKLRKLGGQFADIGYARGYYDSLHILRKQNL